MRAHKRKKFIWTPPHMKLDRLGLPVPPRKPEIRKPLFWLTSVGYELYFVNNTNETLRCITASIAGFQTCDDAVLPMSEKGYSYNQIAPLDGVMIEEFDPILDSDFIFQISVTLHSPTLGKVDFRSPIELNNYRDIVLLWETGEVGKYIYMGKQSNDTLNTSLDVATKQ